MLKKLSFIVLLCCASAPLLASDLAKEQRWREQVVGDLFDGEAITLNEGELDFLGLITLAEPAKDDAVLILHGIGIHPDWPQVINPLRVQLAELGWTTLSIQLPVLDNETTPVQYDAVVPEAAPRILAGIKHLKAQGAKGVYVLAHSMGARMASYFLAQNNEAVKGFVGIGMNVGTVQYLDKIKLPFLDLYGSDDLEGVLASAPDRAVASAHNKAYQQSVVQGADHFFNEMDEALIEEVEQWILAQ
ncbi:MAG: alpha/beta fold hydrolase [Arenicellales bacterium]